MTLLTDAVCIKLEGTDFYYWISKIPGKSNVYIGPRYLSINFNYLDFASMVNKSISL